MGRSKPRQILAIDPGSEKSAICQTLGGRILHFDKLSNEDLLEDLRMGLYNECEIFVEMIASYGMGVGKEVFDTCVWIGRFSEAYSGTHPVGYVFRRDVKLHLCHSPKASDSNIRYALIDRFGPGKDKAIGLKKTPGPLYGMKADMWQALAVALTAQEKA